MDILDINIYEITSQYMEHIKLMKELDLEIAGDFVAMAASLLHIKSKMLLPNYNEEGEVVQEDPRKELVKMLLDYQKYQNAGQNLYRRYLLGRDVFPRGESYRIEDQMGEVVIEEDNALFALIGAYRRAFKKMSRAVHQVKARTQSIASRILEMRHFFRIGTRTSLSEILHGTVDSANPKKRVQLLISFLSLLELGRLGFVSLFQTETFADIHIETKREVTETGLQRVQEFDSEGASALTQNLFAVPAEVASDVVALAETAEPTLVENESEILQGTLNLDAANDESPEFLSQPENLMESPDTEEIVGLTGATDEEIMAAELELGEDDLPLEVATHAPQEESEAMDILLDIPETDSGPEGIDHV